MAKNLNLLASFLTWSAKMASRPISFFLALSLVVMWTIGGLIWGFTDSWLLIINTISTINAALMVFIIQSTQYRESKALHIKIDELIRSVKDAKNEYIAIEGMEEEELEILRKQVSKSKLKED